MNVEDLRRHLDYLTDKYVSDVTVKSEMYELIHRDGMPAVKAVMATLVMRGAEVDPDDSDLIKDIAFNYL